MIILGIETSCDETAAAVLTNNDKRITILSNVVASSATLQVKYGGIIPEQAAREQIKTIIPVIKEALEQANCQPESIDAIAVTVGPGLIGSLLVGVETAKTLALVWKKPLIPVNHLIGHFYANWIDKSVPQFPCIGLLVSGGHTDLVLFKNHGKYQYLGGTRDDAAGECFDKCARLLGLPYPGGPAIARLAKKGDPKTFDLPRPMIDSGDFDFSFSGLKTAVANLLHASKDSELTSEMKCNLAASIQQAIVDVLIAKTILAAQTYKLPRTESPRFSLISLQEQQKTFPENTTEFSAEDCNRSIQVEISTQFSASDYKIDQIMIAGGVAANQELIRKFKFQIVSQTAFGRTNFKLRTKLFVPPPELCTDNAVMIASVAYFNPQTINPLLLQAQPGLSFDQLTIGRL